MPQSGTLALYRDHLQEMKVRVTQACAAYPTSGGLVPVVPFSKMNPEVILKRSQQNPDLGKPAEMFIFNPVLPPADQAG